MKRIEKSIVIEAPVAVVFGFLDDITQQPRWMPGLVEVFDIRGEGAQRRYGWTFKVAGVPVKGETTTAEWVENARLVEKTGGAIESAWTYVLTDLGGRTRLDLTVEYAFKLKFVGRFAEPLIYKQNVRDAETGMQNIKRLVERRT